MKIKDLAKELDVTPKYLRVMAQQGKLPFIKVMESEERNTYIVLEDVFSQWKQD